MAVVVLSGVETRIEIKGLAELMRKLSPDLYADPLATALKKTMLSVQADAIVGAKPHSGDTGQLARSIKVSGLTGTPVPLSGRVYTDLRYAVPAEFGRRPGTPPPVAPIRDWLRRHGGDVERAFIVARGIGRRGTRGLFFMQKAADKMPDYATKFLAAAVTEIERRFAR